MSQNNPDSIPTTSFTKRANFYRQTAGWLWIDLFRHYWGSMLLLLITSATAAVGRIATFAGLLGGLTHLVTSDPTSSFIPLPGIASLPTIPLPILGGGLFTVAAVAALATLLEAQIRVRLGQRYSQLAMARVVDAMRHGHHDLLPPDRETGETTQLRRLVGGDALILVRAVQSITALVFPVCLFVVSIAAAFILSWPLATAFLCLAPIYLFAFIRLNRRVARASDRRDRQATTFRRATNSVTHALALPQYAPTLGHQLGLQHVYSRAAKKRLGNLEELLMNRYRVQFLNGTIIAVAIVLIFSYMWLVGGVDTADLARFAMFAVALRFGSTAANGVSTALAGFSRFLPQFQSYVEFCRSVPDSVHESLAARSDSLPKIRPGNNSHPGTEPELTVGTGQLLFVWDDQHLSPQRLPIWWRHLTGDALPPDVFFIPRPKELPDAPLVHLLTGDTSPTAAQRREALNWFQDTVDIDVSSLRRLLPCNWSHASDSLTQAQQATVAARSVLIGSPRCIAVNASTWRKVPPGLRTDLSGRPATDVLVVGVSWVPWADHADKVIALRKGGVIFIGHPASCPGLSGNHTTHDRTDPDTDSLSNTDDDDLLET